MNIQELKTVQTIARHFGLSKKSYIPAVEKSLKENENIFFSFKYFDNDYVNFPAGIMDTNIVVSTQKESNISKLWNYKKFCSTLLGAHFLNATHQDSFEEILFCYVHGTDVFTVRESEVYSGLGGIFIKEFYNSGGGIVIEPLKNFLEDNYPVELAA